MPHWYPLAVNDFLLCPFSSSLIAPTIAAFNFCGQNLTDFLHQGPPATEHIFSKRLALSDRRAVYSPAQEHFFAETTVGRHDDEQLQLRVR